jgi:hypothetical protein
MTPATVFAIMAALAIGFEMRLHLLHSLVGDQ